MLGSYYCFDMDYKHPVEVVTEHVWIDDKATDLIIAKFAKPLLGL